MINEEIKKEETTEEVMISFSLGNVTSPSVSLRAFLERLHVYVMGNTLTLSPFPTWLEDADSAHAYGREDHKLACAIDEIDVDRSFRKMLKRSYDGVEDYPDDHALLRDILIKHAAWLIRKFGSGGNN